MGRSVTHNLLAGADGPRREHRGGALSQSHLALVLGRAVTHDLLAGADGPRREHRGGALSQSHLALVLGRAVTHDLLAHNGPPGIHDLMHRMSPVYESPPSWYPTAYNYWDRTPTGFQSWGHRREVLALAGLEYWDQG